MKHHNIKDVKERAQGRWRDILSNLCPDLNEALSQPGKHADCVIHGGKKDFRLFKDYEQTGGGVCTCGAYKDGFDLIGAVNRCTLDQAITDVADILGMNHDSQPTVTLRSVAKPVVDPKVVEAKNKKLLSNLEATWNGSFGIGKWQFKLADQYFQKRGLTPINESNVIRLHPALKYYDEDKNLVGTYPAIVAKAQDPDGESVSLHRTYITFTGEKADVEDSKKLMAYPSTGSMKGAAIRLFEAGAVLGLTEGIENAYAVHEATKMPVWACISNILLERVMVPKHVQLVVIWADKDRSGAGQESANVLAKRLIEEGFQVIIKLPHGDFGDQKGIDWLDMLNREGAESFFDEQTVASVAEEPNVLMTSQQEAVKTDGPR